MPQLLLVTEDAAPTPRELAALARLLPDWNVEHCAASQTGLRLNAQQVEQDIVLVCLEDAEAQDELLGSIRQLAPSAVRIVLADKTSLTPPKIAYAHQVLARRDHAEDLLPVLHAALQVRHAAASHSVLARILGDLHEVPSPPALYFDLRDQIDQQSGDLQGMAAVASRDPGMVAKILKVANSGFYGLPRTVSNLDEALALIGTDALLGMVLAAHLYSGLPPPGLNLEVLWQHAQQVSALARQVAAEQGASRSQQSTAAVAGMLHDIGIIVLLENEPALYQPMWRQAAGNETRLAQLERASFGVTHGELGALILRLWGLPDEVVDAVAYSHLDTVDNAEELTAASRAVIAAEWLLTGEDDSPPAALAGIGVEHLEAWRAEQAAVTHRSRGAVP